MSTKRQQAEIDKAEAVEWLRDVYPKGSTVYTVLRSSSRSGLSREIGIVAIRDGGTTILHPNYRVGIACDYRMNKQGDGLKVQGGGMDMGFAVVYDLASVLYGDGYALNHRWI